MVEAVVIVALIALDGVFALSEIAVVSSPKARLRQLVEEGHPNARVTLDLAEMATASTRSSSYHKPAK